MPSSAVVMAHSSIHTLKTRYCVVIYTMVLFRQKLPSHHIARYKHILLYCWASSSVSERWTGIWSRERNFPFLTGGFKGKGHAFYNIFRNDYSVDQCRNNVHGKNSGVNILPKEKT